MPPPQAVRLYHRCHIALSKAHLVSQARQKISLSATNSESAVT